MSKMKCCLLVEDDSEDRELFIEALHNISSTISCCAVGNGEEALFALLRENFEPDYIFTDLNMPHMNGLEFLKILRGIEKFKDIPVIVLSTECSEEQIQKIKQLGDTAFYHKTRTGIIDDVLKKYFGESQAHQLT